VAGGHSAPAPSGPTDSNGARSPALTGLGARASRPWQAIVDGSAASTSPRCVSLIVRGRMPAEAVQRAVLLELVVASRSDKRLPVQRSERMVSIGLASVAKVQERP
jgi:hypothetical protein